MAVQPDRDRRGDMTRSPTGRDIAVKPKRLGKGTPDRRLDVGDDEEAWRIVLRWVRRSLARTVFLAAVAATIVGVAALRTAPAAAVLAAAGAMAAAWAVALVVAIVRRRRRR